MGNPVAWDQFGNGPNKCQKKNKDMFVVQDYLKKKFGFAYEIKNY